MDHGGKAEEWDRNSHVLHFSETKVFEDDNATRGVEVPGSGPSILSTTVVGAFGLMGRSKSRVQSCGCLWHAGKNWPENSPYP